MGDKWKSKWLEQYGIPGLIFLLAFLPRAIYPVSHPMQWYSRSVRFSDAVLRGDWAGTFQRHHPGVTTMWLSGLGLQLFGRLRGLTSDQLLGLAPTKPGVITQAVVSGILPLAFVIAVSIVLCYSLIRRLAGSRAAFAAAWLLALDPYYIARSQVLHVDALLATFMLVSALFLLDYICHQNWGNLLMSGVFGGLALLSKSPALFLFPYVGLAAGMHELLATLQRPGARKRWRVWLSPLWGTLKLVLLWSAIAAVTFAAIWPAMWVQPAATVAQIAQNLTAKVQNPHDNPIFFNGRITFEDPGPCFYVATLPWKTTAITLPMIVLAVALAAVWFHLKRRDSIVVLSLVAYAGFYVLQMSLGARKEMRYILPAFLALDVVAAFGLVWTTDLMAGIPRLRTLQWLPSLITIGALALQAALVLPRHPYYGTLHNRLLGGTKAAQHVLPLQHEGEGLDLAAQYLNSLPRAQRASAGLYRRSASIFRRNFVGLTSIANDPRANYRIYYINQVMRRLGGDAWEETWHADQQNEPLWTVAFDGVTYVWVYGAPPPKPAADGPEYEVNYRLGEHIELKRVRINAKTFAPGDELTVVPLWVSDGDAVKSYKVFCHVLSESGALVAQRDGYPLSGVRQVPSWRDSELIEDSYVVQLGEDLRPGEYQLSLGMYDPESLERLPVYDLTGNRVPDDRVVVASVRIEAPEAEVE